MNDPSAASRSSAPLPPRTGMSETWRAPRRSQAKRAKRRSSRPARPAGRRAFPPAGRRERRSRRRAGRSAARVKSSSEAPLPSRGAARAIDGLEPERDLESAVEAPRERRGAVADQPRMTLDHHAVEPPHQRGDGLVVVGWDRPRVEEVAGVVELDDRGLAPQRGEAVLDLSRYRARGCRALDRVAPEIAEDAGPGTFRAGEEERRGARDRSVGLALLLFGDAERRPRIDDGTRRSQRADRSRVES